MARSVQTMVEVFDMLESDGYRVRFQFLPLNPGHAPELQTLDKLVSLIHTAPRNAQIFFNCQVRKINKKLREEKSRNSIELLIVLFVLGLTKSILCFS